MDEGSEKEEEHPAVFLALCLPGRLPYIIDDHS